MLGTEKLVDGLFFIIKFGESLNNKLEDNKITFWEGFSLVFTAGKGMIKTIRNAPDIIDEYNDLDQEEKREIFEKVKTELNIPANKLRETIEVGIDTIVGLSKFVRIFQKF